MSLIQNPMHNANSLANHLEGTHLPLKYGKIRRILSKLYENRILRNEHQISDPVLPKNKRMKTDVEASYNPYKLGLLRQHLIIFDVKDQQALKKFGSICDAHPYTHYRTQAIGSGLHLYAQFDIPASALAIMDEFYEAMTNELRVDDYQVLTPNHGSSSIDQLNLWTEKDGWTFTVFGDSENTDTTLQHTWNNLEVSNNTFMTTEFDNHLDSLDELDMKLLRELSINAKIGPKELETYYDRDQSTISRRLKYLRENILRKPTLYYNRRFFDISSPLLIRGTTGNIGDINRLHRIIDDNHIPFRSFLTSHKKDYLTVLWSPPSYISELAYFFWNHSQTFWSANLRIGDVSWSYPFYNLNYDPEINSWKDAPEYIIDEPLSSIS